MSRPTLNFLHDSFMALLLLGLLSVSTVIQCVFPPGVAAEGWTVWGWNCGVWRQGQYGLIVLFCLAVLVHLILHWTWVFGFVTTRLRAPGRVRKPSTSGVKTIYGVGLLVVALTLLVTFVAAAEFGSKPPAKESASGPKQRVGWQDRTPKLVVLAAALRKSATKSRVGWSVLSFGVSLFRDDLSEKTEI